MFIIYTLNKIEKKLKTKGNKIKLKMNIKIKRKYDANR